MTTLRFKLLLTIGCLALLLDTARGQSINAITSPQPNFGGIAIDASDNVYLAPLSGSPPLVDVFGAGAAAVVPYFTSAAATSIASDRYGNLFILTSGGILYYPVGSFSGNQSSISAPNGAKGLAVDSSGNLYIGSSLASGTISKVPAGSTTAATFISSGLSTPVGLTFDSAGNLYIANQGNNTISKVAAGTTTPTTFISSGLNSPAALAFDSGDNLYILNKDNVTGNAIVSKVAAGTSAVSTFISSGLGGASGLAFDSSDTLYIASGSRELYVVTSTPNPIVAGVNPCSGPLAGGTSVTISGLNFTGATAVRFGVTAATTFTVNSSTSITATAPAGVASAVDITVTTASGTSAARPRDQFTYLPAATTLISSGLSTPTALAFDSAGNLYIANQGNNTISKVAARTSTATTYISAGLSSPGSLAFDSGNSLYILNGGNATISKVAAGTSTASTFISSGLFQPAALAFDSSDNLYIGQLDSISRVAAGTNTATTVVADPPVTFQGLAHDTSGNVYFAGSRQSTFINLIGKIAAGSSAPAALTIAGLNGAVGVVAALARDPSGDLFVVDESKILKVAAGSKVATTFISSLSGLSGITFDSSGNLYVVNSTANTVVKYTVPYPSPAITAINASSGPVAGGTVVTLTGTNFTGATAVNFGATAASAFTVNSDTQITATAPAGSAGAVDITATTAWGTSATGSGDQFTYAVPSGPAVTSVSPSSGLLAGGTSVTITGTGFTGATAVNFGSTAATSFTFNSDTSITATSPVGSAGAVDITVTTAQGTSAISQPADQFTYVTAPSVTSVSTASGTYGSSISTYTIAGSNSPTSFNATGLPPGLSVNTGNGQITGTPTDTSGSPYSVTLSATNAGGTGTATLTFTINQAALTISGVTANNKTYDGTTTATLGGTPTLSGTVNGDTLTLNTGSASGTFADQNVGTGKTVNTSGFSVTGTNASNYTLTQPTTTASISAKTLTVSGVTASNKIYDGTAAATLGGTPALVGVVSGDPTTLNSSGASGTFADANVGTGKTVNASGFSLNNNAAGDYSLTQPTTTANVSAKALTVTGLTASNKLYDGTTAATLTGTAALQAAESGGAGSTSDGKPYSGDTILLGGTASGTFASSAVGNNITVNVTGLTLSGPQASNYSLTQPTLSANITGALGFIGTSTALTANLNSSAIDISGLLHVSDSDIGNTVTWSQSVAPLHGTLTFTSATASSGSTDIAPDGTITYTPAANSSAADSFTVQVSDGTNSVTRTINVTFLGQGTAGSQFVAVGDSGVLLTSPDAATWTSRTSGTALRLRGVAASGNLIVAVGQSGTVLTSPDGAAWTSRTSGATETLRGIAASPTRFVAVGGDTASLVRYSDDGTNWSGTTVPSVGKLRAVAFGGGKFLAVGAAGGMLTSPDGVTWTQQNSGTTNDLEGAVWTGTKFTVLSSTGAVLTSTDGVSWSSVQALPPSWIEGLTWSNTQFVTVGTSGKVKNSPDGTSWSWQTSGTTNTLHGVTWTGVFTAQIADPVALTSNLRTIFISGVTAVSKIYDATVTASLNVASAVLSGVDSGDTVNLSTSSAAGTFTDKTVGNGKNVATSGFSISGTNAGDYTLVQPATTANITAKALTVTGVTAGDKTYDSTATATLNTSSAALSGVVNGDTVNLSSASASGAFADKTVGSNKTVTISGFSISGADAANYSLTQPTTTAIITAKTLTVTGVAANSKIYDGGTVTTLVTGSAALSGVISGDTVSLATGTATGAFADKAVGTGKTVTISGFSLGGTDAANYALTQPAATANITAKALTVTGVTASNKVYDGAITATLNAAGAALSGVVIGDAVNLSAVGATGAFADKTVASGKTVTTSGFALSGTDAANYSLAQPSTTANITAKSLTITGVTATNKVYDGTTTATLNTSSAALSGIVSGDAVTLASGSATGAFADKTVGTAKAVATSGFSLSGNDASNYTLTQPSATASITSKALTVTGVTASNKVYDGTTTASLNTGSATLSGAISGDSVSLDPTSAVAVFADKDANTGKSVGSAGFALNGTDASNYSLTQPSFTADITPKTLSVSGVTASDKVYDATTAATLSGTAALSATETAGTGTTIDSKPYTGDDVTLSGTMSGAFADMNAGTGKTITVSGLTLGGAQAADYVLGGLAITANITAKPLTVSGLSASDKIYDGTTTAPLTGAAALPFAEAPGSGLATDGLPYTGDAVTAGGTLSGTFASKAVATGVSVTVTGLSLSGAQASNYSATPPSGLTANITAKSLTVSGITAANKSYDGTTRAILNTASATLVGVISGDTVALSTTSATGTFANASAGSNKAVTITGVVISGADSGNYTLTQPSATANINQAGVTITLSNLNQTYDGSTKSVGVSTSPNVATSTTYNGSGTAPTDAGSYSIAVSVTDSNYTGSASGTLTIAQASQSVSFSLSSGTIGSSVPLSASASSGLPVTFSIVSGSGVITGSSLTISGAGSITVRASQAGNANYQPASTDATITGIAKLDQTITFGALADKRANDAAFTLNATASSGLPVTFTVASGPALLSGNTLTLSGAPGLVSIVASQAGNATYNAAPNVTQTFTVVGVSPLIYFGSIGGSGMAAEVSPDGKSGTMIGTLPGTGEGFVVNFDPSTTGDFVATVTTFGGSGTSATTARIAADESGAISIQRAVQAAAATSQTTAAIATAGATRTFRGHVSGGVLSGSVDGVANANFSANLVPATGPTQAIAGYYQSSSLDTATGSIYSVVGTNDQVYVLAITPTYVGGNTGTANANGTFNVQAPGQTTISGSVDAPTTTVTGTLTQPGTPAQNFSGLAVTTIRTDRLINLSSRAQVTSGDNVLIAGFVIGGTTPKTVLLRGVGPGLSGFGLSGVLAKPMLQLYNSTGRQLLANSGWGGDATISATSARVGAFGLSATSADAAMTTTLNPGAYTMVITNAGTDAGGVALAEIYDASLNPSADYQRLINISTRGNVTNGGGVLIGGFVVTGNAPKKLLIRGVGPALTAFGVSGALADPQLQVFSNNATLLAQNNDWSTPQALTGAQTPATGADLTTAANATGAFALASGSKDAAVIVELAPGAYTAQVSGVAGATGTALVEIYEVPTN